MSFGNTVFTVHIPEVPRTFFNDYPNNAHYKWFGFSFTNNRWLNQQYLRNLAYQKKKFDGTISGIVSDESSYLLGVSVRIKGTNFGTETNFDGAYSIRVNKGDTLVFSYVGMQSVEKVVTNFSDINVLMESDNSTENIITMGYASVDTSRKLQEATNGIEMAAETSPESAEEDQDNLIENSEEKKTFKEMNFRKNLKETAFFFPQLKTDKDGSVSFEFTTPEALTSWKLQVLAHTKNLYSGIKTEEIITQKQVMVTPSLPRFLRKGDSIVIPAKITNTTTKILEGTANISFHNPLTGERCAWIPDNTSKREYRIDAAGNTQVYWKLKVPDTLDLVQIKIAAQAGNFSDGEQTTIPVLSNRTLVTEALPLWTSEGKSKTFTLEKLINNTSKTLLNHKLTLEITSNPVWYAIQALPYLLESNAAGSEQIFSRYYANSIAQYITSSNPKIEEVFTQWASADLLISNLEKNQELKSILLEETPWIREAQSEEEQRKRIALLFEIHKIKGEKQRIASKLKQMQLPNGGFPWFKGNPQANRSITQHIVTGFGHLQQLSISELDALTTEIIEKALLYLDNEIAYHYQKLQDKALRIKKTEGIAKSVEFLQKIT
ncbi:alpha-2-macroglobulin family protein [Tenacibaculum sp. SG-28]|uniref:alpha-2-macroglobulin family protein n=1 Tax=Tenacibaculum sp. SG-28 TaxID=754426 RepID=UPI000D4AA0D5|nr:alpha-2-macroglobulin family protein [Tenacibaculum sp. SG-28]PQJ20632.1 hypothetical protein BSU00_10010 [Tenacibaculum sp. SG-28]